MMVTATMPARSLNLVGPLPHEGTAMHTTGTGRQRLQRPGAVTTLTVPTVAPWGGHVDSPTPRRTGATTPGRRTSRTATATTTTRTTASGSEPSADSHGYTFAALVQAYADCRRTKRNSASALAFEQHQERHLFDLHHELLAGTWRPGRAYCFVVTSPKPREVWAAPFRDRIVHHLLYNQVAPRIEASFVHTSCACIKGRGTLYAAQQLEHMVRSITRNWQRPAWYLKIDLANFFVAIDKRVLQGQLHRRITDAWWRDLADTILMHDPRTDYELRGDPALMALVPPHKRLTNAPADTGLPIGNLSSQFFANVYLNALDQHAKHDLKARRYVRYVDDAVLLHETPQWLNAALADITAWLPEHLHADINPRKTVLQPVDRGIDFVGHLIKPWSHRTRPRMVNRALQRIATMPAADTFAAGNSYLGLVGQATHSHHDQTRIASALRSRGHVVAGDINKIYRRGP